jgi:hypothetical protein
MCFLVTRVSPGAVLTAACLGTPAQAVVWNCNAYQLVQLRPHSPPLRGRVDSHPQSCLRSNLTTTSRRP